MASATGDEGAVSVNDAAAEIRAKGKLEVRVGHLANVTFMLWFDDDEEMYLAVATVSLPSGATPMVAGALGHDPDAACEGCYQHLLEGGWSGNAMRYVERLN